MERLPANGKYCPKCKREFWPRISPAIIVLVKRKEPNEPEKILLVRSHNFRGDFHGLVAGFLEMGESLEECVIREVYEETSLKIKNLKYFGSQSWPYPSNIMIGFVADYDGGEIVVQESELKSASWYTIDNLPRIPEKLSIARKLIDYWIDSLDVK
jgi:NAD+ diphosphatase